MATLPFTKVEGLGNDFVVVDLRPATASASGADAAIQQPAVVRAVCDRHFGIGADGVLAILPGIDGDARMRVLNADGSEAEMCGNGIRCVAKVLYDADPTLRRPVLRIDTGAGLLACAIDAEDGQAQSVAVEMGRPRLTRAEIPMQPAGSERAVRAPISARGTRFKMTAVSMGNPHAVMFVDSSDDLRRLAETIGPTIERHAWFPQRTNVEIAHVRAPQRIDLVVWERGCGITLACGTGACATAVAAITTGRCDGGGEIRVLPELGGVKMRGPAVRVFDGQLAI